MLYLHAFQSLIWNIVATYRWAKHGGKAVEGDLVRETSPPAPHNPAPAAATAADAHVASIDADGEPILAPAAHDRAGTTEPRIGAVRPITAEDAASDRFSIVDVLLPLPGRHTTFPPNLRDFFVATMREETHGGLDAAKLPAKVAGMNVGGDYRALVARPGAEWDVRVVAYDAIERQVAWTDWDRLAAEGKMQEGRGDGKEMAEASGGGASVEATGERKGGAEGDVMQHGAVVQDTDGKAATTTGEVGSDEKQKVGSKMPAVPKGEFDEKGLPVAGQVLAGEVGGENESDLKLAAVVRFQLGAGTYATMALREMSKGGIRMYEPAHGRF